MPTIQEKYQKIAELVIERNMNVKKGEQVMIHTWDHTLDAAGEFLYAVRCKGANPMIRLIIEDHEFRSLRELDAKALRTKNMLAKALATAENVDIFFAGPKDPTLYQKVPYEKIHAMQEDMLSKEIEAIHKRRKVRSAFVNIGQVSNERARAYGLDFEPWRDAMLNALMTNPDTMSKIARPLTSALKSGRKGEFISSDGSVLRFKLAGRAPVLDDGVLRPEDIRRGDNFVHLPSGVVFSAPLEGSAEGRIAYDLPQPSRGRWVRGIWAEVKKGLLTGFGASENEEELKGSIGEIKKKISLGYLTIGVNPEAKPFFIDNQMAPGVIGIHFGDNTTFGGKIKTSQYRFGGFSEKATLSVDGKTLVDKGKIVA